MTFLASFTLSAIATWLFVWLLGRFPILGHLLILATLIGAICYVW